jgi:hypothetical protein
MGKVRLVEAEVELIANGLVAAGVTPETGAGANSDGSNAEVVLGVSARTDMGLLATVKAARPNKKEKCLKEILFTFTPQK